MARHKTRNRLILGGALAGAVAVSALAFRWLRAQNELPPPAAAPPSVRDVSRNGSAPSAPEPAGTDASLN